MKFCLSWLEEWLNTRLEPETLAETLTMAGVEVKQWDKAIPASSGIVAGLVSRLDDHPGTAGLKLCRVDIGRGSSLQTVCGTSSVSAGMCVPTAPAGARIQGRRIKAIEVDGVLSEGVLCSAGELGIGDDSAEIPELGEAVTPGTDIVGYLRLDDTVLELDLTPNRADCFSLLGLAREVAAIQGRGLDVPSWQALAPAHDRNWPVRVEEPEACPRYLARVVRNIDATAVTPLWMKERLRKSGVRSVHPVVDVMNYTMLDIGQPLHAFDLDRIEGEIVVRYAKAGEDVEIIGGTQTRLNDRTLLVADARRPLALAGIIGGAGSAVSPSTRNLLLECAFFKPAAIMGRARSYGLRTEASLRFERGVDPGLQEHAIERASQLLKSVTGGEFGPVSPVVVPAKAKQPITLRHDAAARCLGVEIGRESIPAMLEHLGCQVEPCDGGWHCTPPSYRFDLDIEEDLIEEIARLYGYNKIGSERNTCDAGADSSAAGSARFRDDRCHRLVERGYTEVMTYSFVDPDQASQLSTRPSLQLRNPVSPSMSVMRTSLWPGLLKVLMHNLNRQQARVRIFETGHCFDERSEWLALAGLAYGSVYPEQWGESSRACDFYDLKGDLHNLLAEYSAKLSYEALQTPPLHPGQAAAVLLDGKPAGCLGALAPALAQRLGIGPGVFLFEINLDALPQPGIVQTTVVAAYPSVRRDISLQVPAGVSAAQILACIDGLAIKVLQSVVIFDVYEGTKSRISGKSMALRLIFQDVSSTLEEAVCRKLTEKVTAALADTLKINLRE